MDEANGGGLISLPMHLIKEQILPRVPADSVLQMFRTCSLLRNSALQHALLVHLRMSSGLDTQTCASSLRLACQHAQQVHLIFEAGTDPACVPVAATAALHAAGPQIAKVQHVTIKGMHLYSLTPAWLTARCPQLSSLELEKCLLLQDTTAPATNPSAPATDPSAPAINHNASATGFSESATNPSAHEQPPSIHSLHLVQCEFQGNEWGMWMQAQVRAIAGLKSLHLMPPIVVPDLDHTPPLISWLPAISQQLTCLATDIHRFRRFVRATNSPQLFAQWLPQLAKLKIHDGTVMEADFQHILSLPSLRELYTRCHSLERSYRDAPCQWTVFSVGELHVEQVQRLPHAALSALKLHRVHSKHHVFLMYSAQAHEQEAQCLIAQSGHWLSSDESDCKPRSGVTVRNGSGVVCDSSWSVLEVACKVRSRCSRIESSSSSSWASGTKVIIHGGLTPTPPGIAADDPTRSLLAFWPAVVAGVGGCPVVCVRLVNWDHAEPVTVEQWQEFTGQMAAQAEAWGTQWEVELSRWPLDALVWPVLLAQVPGLAVSAVKCDASEDQMMEMVRRARPGCRLTVGEWQGRQDPAGWERVCRAAADGRVSLAMAAE